MSWTRALEHTVRTGMTIERASLEPLVALRATVGLALVIGAGLALLGPGAAASSAFGAFLAAIAAFQPGWRPRPVLALASGLTLAGSTFAGYLGGASNTALFLALLAVWTFLTGLVWAAGATAGIIASGNVAIMLVTVTLPTSMAQAAGHAAMHAAGGGGAGAPPGPLRGGRRRRGRALAARGRGAMLLEAHVPDRAQAPVPGAAALAEAPRAETEAGATAVRERRVPE
ncbi:hypothetical protein AMK15_11850 [Streptomyces sp. MJM1172]|nr:hypothetical protein AMK15_11850 [Streptomyces sp. MJM1172]